MAIEFKPTMSSEEYVKWCVETLYQVKQRELSQKLFEEDQRGEMLYNESVEKQKSDLALLHNKAVTWLTELTRPRASVTYDPYDR